MRPIKDTLSEYLNTENIEDRQFINLILETYKDKFVVDSFEDIFREIFNNKELRKDIITLFGNRVPTKLASECENILSISENVSKFVSFLKEYLENLTVLLFYRDYFVKNLKKIINNDYEELQFNLRNEETIKWVYYRNSPQPVFENKKEAKKIEIKKSDELVKRKDKLVYIDELCRVNLVKGRLELLNIRRSSCRAI